MQAETENKGAASSGSPESWDLGASVSLNNWSEGHVDIARFAEAGIRWIELSWRNDSFDLFDADRQEVCAEWIGQIRGLGMDVWTLHLPYGTAFDISAAFGEDDGGIASEAVRRHIGLMRLAQKWGIRKVVLHPSWEPTAEADRPDRLARCKRSLVVLADEAERLGITIAVECLPRTCLGHTSEEMRELVEADDRLGICCDVNHLLKESPESFIRKLGRRIVTVHMSDYDGVDERHWLPGQGIIRWNEVIRALAEHGYAGPFLYEVRRPDPNELASCWRGLLADYGRAYG